MMMSHKRQRKHSWSTTVCKNNEPALSHLFEGGNEASSNKECQSYESSSFFTLRLEHRVGGAIARYPGEERILLFRSDRAGSIAKIIYTPQKIHVLSVKPEYRGRGLGALLFRLATEQIRSTFLKGETKGKGNSTTITLDVEEDIGRYNKLITFYEQLGCQVKQSAKVKYLNNNDGQLFRNVPMTCVLRQQPEKDSMSGIDFLPVQLRQVGGKRADIPSCTGPQQLHWLALDQGNGQIRFRATLGCFLNIQNGRVASCAHPTSNFKLLRVSDNNYDNETDVRLSDTQKNITKARNKELWMIQSSDGFYLTIVSDCLDCSKTPAFWQIENLSLISTTDTPPLRQQYRKMWAHQTVDFVTRMRRKYLQFNLARMTLKDALDLVKGIPYQPFAVDSTNLPSLRTLCFTAAERARKEGFPDWVQLAALVHELGRVVSRISNHPDEDGDYDWTIVCQSRVVGCLSPDRASFGEFRFLNRDERSTKYNSEFGMYQAHCGFERLLLVWAGPEYMYEMLKHNDVCVPEECLAMIRLFVLDDWHSHNEYSHLANTNDEDMQEMIAGFDRLIRSAKRECVVDLTNKECNNLWTEYYYGVAAKYGLDNVLKW